MPTGASEDTSNTPSTTTVLGCPSQISEATTTPAIVSTPVTTTVEVTSSSTVASSDASPPESTSSVVVETTVLSSRKSQTTTMAVDPTPTTTSGVMVDSSTANPFATSASTVVIVGTPGLVYRSSGESLQATTSLEAVRISSTSGSIDVRPSTAAVTQGSSNAVGPTDSGKASVDLNKECH